MNGHQMKYDNYIKSLDNLCGPYSLGEIPNVKIDYKGMVKYAHFVNKTVPELTDDELAPFVLNMSVKEMKAKKLIANAK